MSNSFIKTTGQVAADAARKTARQMAQEPYEMVKTIIPPRIIEGAKKEDSSLVSEIVESGNTQPNKPVSEEAVKIQTNKRLQELEEEIEQIRQERKAKEEEWKKGQETLLQPEQPMEKQFIEPQGKKKQGFLGFAKKKQGTKEMGKQISG